jgi:hypothetical protein
MRDLAAMTECPYTLGNFKTAVKILRERNASDNVFEALEQMAREANISERDIQEVIDSADDQRTDKMKATHGMKIAEQNYNWYMGRGLANNDLCTDRGANGAAQWCQYVDHSRLVLYVTGAVAWQDASGNIQAIGKAKRHLAELIK